MEPTTKELSLFDHLDGLTILKRPYEPGNTAFTKGYNQFMINRFIGMNDSFLPLITELHRLQNLPDDVHYNFLLKYLPKKKCYFRYVSKIKNSVDRGKVEMLMTFFDISEKDAIDYLEIIPAKELNKVFKQYKSQGGVISKRKK